MTRREGPPTRSPADARALEQGHPHLCRLVDDHPDDAPTHVAEAARKATFTTDPIYFVEWPREVAGRFLRAFGRGGDDAPAELSTPGWPAATDVPRIVRSIVLPPNGTEPVGNAWGRHAYPFAVAAVVYLLEAAFGADPVLDAVVEAWRAYAERDAVLARKSRRPQNYPAGALAIPTGMLLLRASPEASRSARTELERLVGGDPAAVHDSYGLHALDLVLHGRAAFERSGWQWVEAEGWLFVVDDPGWVRHAVGTSRGVFDPDVRAIWLGGVELVPFLLKHVKKAKKTAVPHLLEAFGMIADPAVRPILDALAKKAPAGKPSATKAKKPKKPTKKQIELGYDRIVDDLVAALQSARGRADDEAAALRAATDAFIALRTSYDAEPTEHLGHFFAVDGVGHEKARPSAWARLRPTEDESARWMAILDEAG